MTEDLEQAKWPMWPKWSWKMIDEGLFLGLRLEMRAMTRFLRCWFRQFHPSHDSWIDLPQSVDFRFDEDLPGTMIDHPKVWCAAPALEQPLTTLLCLPLSCDRGTKCILLGNDRPSRTLDFDVRHACAIGGRLLDPTGAPFGTTNGWAVCSWRADVAILNLGLEVVRAVSGGKSGIDYLSVDAAGDPIMYGCWDRKAWVVKAKPSENRSFQLSQELIASDKFTGLALQVQASRTSRWVSLKMLGMVACVDLRDDARRFVAAICDPDLFKNQHPIAGLKSAFPAFSVPDDLPLAIRSGTYYGSNAKWLSPDLVVLEARNVFSLKNSRVQFTLPLEQNSHLWVSENPDLFWATSTGEGNRTNICRFRVKTPSLNRFDQLARSVLSVLPDDEARKSFAASVASLQQTPYQLIHSVGDSQ